MRQAPSSHHLHYLVGAPQRPWEGSAVTPLLYRVGCRDLERPLAKGHMCSARSFVTHLC